MNKQLLIVDGNALAAENLRLRIAAFGDVTVAANVDQAKAAMVRTWDLVITDWSLGALEGPALIQLLQPSRQPLWLYTDKADVVEGGPWGGLGVQKAFTRLQRANLVVELEALLDGHAPTASAPNFLLVEDSPTVRQFVKAILKDAFPGSEIIEADDGRTALAAMKSSRVNVIVTDLQMPGMDGLSFVQLLRNNAILKKKPVIVLSGQVTDEARAMLSHLDKVQILIKPAKPEALVGAVKALLS